MPSRQGAAESNNYKVRQGFKGAKFRAFYHLNWAQRLRGRGKVAGEWEQCIQELIKMNSLNVAETEALVQNSLHVCQYLAGNDYRDIQFDKRLKHNLF